MNFYLYNRAYIYTEFLYSLVCKIDIRIDKILSCVFNKLLNILFSKMFTNMVNIFGYMN